MMDHYSRNNIMTCSVDILKRGNEYALQTLHSYSIVQSSFILAWRFLNYILRLKNKTSTDT